MVTDPRMERRYYLHETRTRRAIVALARLLFGAATRMQVEGQDNLPGDGACVLIANHLATLDVFPLQLAVSRPIFFMAKAELFTNPTLDWLLRRLGAFPVERGARDQWAMQHAQKILDQGQVLGMFPEGTRSRGRGLGVAKTGAARLALESNLPLVPVSIEGSQSPLRSFPHRSSLRICVLEPIFPRPDDDPLSLMERGMYSMALNLPPDLRGVYADIPQNFLQ